MIPSHADPYDLVGSQLDGKYDIDAVVARGGFGVVYRAMHVDLRIPVAVKVLCVPEGITQRSREVFTSRFLQEAKIIAHLDHPAIVRIMDHGASNTPSGEHVPWMVLEWIDGLTLYQYLALHRGEGGLAARDALALLRPAFEAVAVAHRVGIAHRDLKPGNLMVTRTPAGEERLRVLDFGIARVMDDADVAGSGLTVTHNPTTAFSPAYAAPEQIVSGRTGPWTDVHALGLLVTELVIDRSPYDRTDSEETYRSALAEKRPTPALHGVDVGAWEPVLLRALALRPADRYADADEFLRALEETVVDARPGFFSEVVTPSHRGHRRRNRVTLGAIAAVTLVALLGWSPWVRSQEAERRRQVARSAPVVLQVPPRVTEARALRPSPPPAPRRVTPAAPPPTAAPVVSDAGVAPTALSSRTSRVSSDAPRRPHTDPSGDPPPL